MTTGRSSTICPTSRGGRSSWSGWEWWSVFDTPERLVALATFPYLVASLALRPRTAPNLIAPLSFSAAARIAGGSQARVDAVIARFNQFNYVGALLGAVLTGVVGQDSLRYGFAVPLVLVLAMLPLARAFAPAPADTTTV